MTDKHQILTLADLFCLLREKLILAREQKETPALKRLMGTFTLIEDAASTVQDKITYSLAETLEDACRDSLMNADWKSNIPSAEEIKQLLT